MTPLTLLTMAEKPGAVKGPEDGARDGQPENNAQGHSRQALELRDAAWRRDAVRLALLEYSLAEAAPPERSTRRLSEKWPSWLKALAC